MGTMSPEYRRRYYQNNKARISEYQRTYYKTKAGGEKKRANAKMWRRGNRELVRNTKLKSSYGISAAEYDRMFARQHGVCAICCRPETAQRFGVVRRLCVDHDHRTNIVRGLLCSWCNLAVGYLKDDPLVARAVAIYLESHSG